jgi:trk system potassium uptake protein TrkH
MMGGGVATTAGGVKLLRVYALARHGQREMERIVHPNSVAGGGQIARRLRREGAYLAFIFFMLFATSIAAVVALVSIQRIEIETATILSIAALTNTGPLAAAIPLTPAFQATAGIASAPWEGWSGLPPFTKAVLAGAMIVGRMETLAVLALFSPQFWRR